jgi:hypothetical protein
MNDLLERAVAPYTGPAGDWERVLRDARVARRRRPLRPLLAFAAVAAVLGIVLAFGGGSPSTIDRALAAAGDGHILHLVTESSLPKTLVDIESGERRVLRGRHEVWFDPRTGARERETLEGVLQWESLNTSPHGREIYASLSTGYRDALRSGRAKVVGETATVHWINISPGHDVAVSRETHRPVAMRVGGHETRILTYETLRAMPRSGGEARLPQRAPGPGGEEISPREAQRLLGRAPLWAGAERPVVKRTEGGVTLEGAGVLVSQGDERMLSLVGLRGYTPPNGTIVIEGTMGVLHTDGLYVAIHAMSEDAILSAARALRPYDGA